MYQKPHQESNENAEVESILYSHPFLKKNVSKIVSIQRLAGLTNKNFLILTNKSPLSTNAFVLRIPGKGTETYIDRKNEAFSATLTANLGINPTVYYFDQNTGIQLTQYIEDSVTMSHERFKNTSSIQKAAESFRILHQSKISFQTNFELFSQIEKYKTYLFEKKATLPEEFFSIQEKAQQIRILFFQTILPTTACHCDPLAENFLETKEKTFIIDWEYSGNNDPIWDLADLSVEAGFDSKQEEILLKAYFQTEKISAFDRARFFIYKAMCDLLWTLWGIIQHTNQNPADDFWNYSMNRLNRATVLISDSEFPEHLRAVELDSSKNLSI